MHSKHYHPSEELKPFIKHYLIIESEEERVNRILPDTSLVMAFRFKGQVGYLNGEVRTLLPSLVLSGLRKSVRLINYQNKSGNILVVFKEAGASVFFREPLHELFEEHISLDNFISSSKHSMLTEQLSEAENNDKRIELVERFLLSRLWKPAPDRLILAAVQKIHNSKGIYKMKDLASVHCLSQDAFEKRFRKTTGSSPKLFSSIVRMKTIIQNKEKDRSYTEIALDAGFADQSHFNKEFKLFTGLTPGDFFKTSLYW